MASDGDWSMTVGKVTVRLAHLGGGGGIGLQLPSRTWRRAARIVDALGADGALFELDARAERALDRGLVKGACSWRDIMAAIHAMSREERFEEDTDH